MKSTMRQAVLHKFPWTRRNMQESIGWSVGWVISKEKLSGNERTQDRKVTGGPKWASVITSTMDFDRHRETDGATSDLELGAHTGVDACGHRDWSRCS